MSAFQAAKSIMGWGYGAAKRHPGIVGAGAGTLGAGLILTTGTYMATRHAVDQVGQAVSNDYMTNLIMKAQSGPFGPSGAGIGIRSRNQSTAGLTLAAHYARNKNKYFGMMGLRFL